MDFRAPALKELTDQQVRFAPAARRREQVDRAAKLLGEIDPAQGLPVPVRLLPDHGLPIGRPCRSADSGGGPEARPGRVHPPGRTVDPAAADRAGGRADPDARRGEQAVQRLDEDHRPVADARPGRPARDRQRSAATWVIPKSLLDRFLAENRDLVGRGSNFSRLGDEERETILYRPAASPGRAATSPKSAGGSPVGWVGRSRRSVTRSRTSTAPTRTRPFFPTGKGRWTAQRRN